MYRVDYIVILFLTLVACTPQLQNSSDINPVTAVPTIDTSTLCTIGQDNTSDLDLRLTALNTLHERFADCDIDINLLLYLTYVEFGDFMERSGDLNAAVSAYNDALFFFPDGVQAQNRLDILRSLEVTEQIFTCGDDSSNMELATYTPTENDFLQLNSNGFHLNGEAFPIYGVTYYPMNSPFERFLNETNLDDVEYEFALIRGSGINTLRIFLRPVDLFECDAPIPRVENFERLDGIIQQAQNANLRLIMVLNQDVPPSTLYSEDFIREQMRFIVERYHDEPTIIAWDVRDNGDADYRTGLVRQDIALRWLADTVVMIRQIDHEHWVTAGWHHDGVITAPLVDFVSFQFYGDYANLRQEIANLRASTNRPILLTSIGYSTFNVSDITQRNLLFQALEEVENNNLMGWVVNHSFDYPRSVTCTPPDCPGTGSEINQYGLWNTGYFPKLTVDAIRIITGIDE